MADAIGMSGCGVDGGEEHNGPRVDIVTSTYTDELLAQRTRCLS